MPGKKTEIEDLKTEIITYLNRIQVSKRTFYSTTSIAMGVRRNQEAVKKALFALAADGFMHIRHDPQTPENITYRLRREGDDPSL